MRVLVTGGTGTLGRPVVEELARAGHEPVVLSRRPRPESAPEAVRWCEGDLRQDRGITAALEGAEVVVHCATAMRGDVLAGSNLVRAALGSRPHLVYISIVGVDRVPLGYYRAKLAVEALVTGSGLEWSLLRATQFHDLVAGLFRLSARLPVMAVPDVTVQSVEVREVAHRLVELATGPPSGRASDFGGPQVEQMTELAHAYGRIRGPQRPVFGLRLPGGAFAAFTRGEHLAEEHRSGTVTFARYLEDRAGGERG